MKELEDLRAGENQKTEIDLIIDHLGKQVILKQNQLYIAIRYLKEIKNEPGGCYGLKILASKALQEIEGVGE